MTINKLFLACDGAARGNPGNASIACVMYDNDPLSEVVMPQGSAGVRLRGEHTNNQAEYQAVIFGLYLMFADDHGLLELQVYSDSQLVVKQINGEWKVNDPVLIKLHHRVKELVYRLRANSIETYFTHVDRSVVWEADEICNRILDRME